MRIAPFALLLFLPSLLAGAPPSHHDSTTAARLQQRGHDLRVAGRIDEARAAYDAAIDADSSFGPSFAGRAWLECLVGHFGAALEDVERARDRGVTAPELALVSGLAHGKLGEFDEAVTQLTVFIRAHPETPDGWYLRGLSRARLGDILEAVDDLTNAIQRGYADPRALIERAALHSTLGEDRLACADVRTAAARGLQGAAALVDQYCRDDAGSDGGGADPTPVSEARPMAPVVSAS